MQNRGLSAEWQVNRSLPARLSEQLRENIRWSISTGQLRRGQQLPSMRNLAKALGVSLHTVRAAYKLLERESLVVIRPKHGTEVIGHPDDNPLPTFLDQSQQLMARTISHGLSKGKTADELRELFEDTLLQFISTQEWRRVAFIECTDKETRYLAKQLAETLGINVDPVVLTDLKEELSNVAAKGNRWQAIVTTFFHYGTVLEAARPHGISVFGVVVESNLDEDDRPDDLPQHPKVGIVSLTIESMQYLRNRVLNVIEGAVVRGTTLDNRDDLADILAWGDAFVVTLACHETVERMLGAHQKPILRCHDQISMQSVQMLEHHLHSTS